MEFMEELNFQKGKIDQDGCIRTFSVALLETKEIKTIKNFINKELIGKNIKCLCNGLLGSHWSQLTRIISLLSENSKLENISVVASFALKITEKKNMFFFFQRNIIVQAYRHAWETRHSSEGMSNLRSWDRTAAHVLCFCFGLSSLLTCGPRVPEVLHLWYVKKKIPWKLKEQIRI